MPFVAYCPVDFSAVVDAGGQPGPRTALLSCLILLPVKHAALCFQLLGPSQVSSLTLQRVMLPQVQSFEMVTFAK